LLAPDLMHWKRTIANRFRDRLNAKRATSIGDNKTSYQEGKSSRRNPPLGLFFLLCLVVRGWISFRSTVSDQGSSLQYIRTLRLSGWRSIVDETIELGPLNVVVGGNGSGKSNLLSVFRVLNAMIGGRLQSLFAADRAVDDATDDWIHHGVNRAKAIAVSLVLQTRTGVSTYGAAWERAGDGRMPFVDERIGFMRDGREEPYQRLLGDGHLETQLSDVSNRGDHTARVIHNFLARSRFYSFSDLSADSLVRRPCPVQQNRFLAPNGQNAAAVLWRYQREHPDVFERIEAVVRQAFPEIQSILPRLSPDGKLVSIDWKRRGTGNRFSLHTVSNGAILFLLMAMLTCQPSAELPLIMAIEEPELGLSPRGIDQLAELMRQASQECQILVTTHSPYLVDACDTEHVIVASQQNHQSQFRRLSDTALEAWLDEYTS
jgi:predicted ATPase